MYAKSNQTGMKLDEVTNSDVSIRKESPESQQDIKQVLFKDLSKVQSRLEESSQIGPRNHPEEGKQENEESFTSNSLTESVDQKAVFEKDDKEEDSNIHRQREAWTDQYQLVLETPKKQDTESDSFEANNNQARETGTRHGAKFPERNISLCNPFLQKDTDQKMDFTKKLNET